MEAGKLPRRLNPAPGAAPRWLFGLVALTLLLGGCASLDERLRTAVYRPSRAVPEAFKGLEPGDRIETVLSGNPDPAEQWQQLWWLPAREAGAPTLLYLHGTFRNLFHNYPKMRAIRDAGFSVLAVEYRGWGGSSPLVPDQQSIMLDAELGWRHFERVQPDPSMRVIFGHSLGGAVAVELAARKSAAGPGANACSGEGMRVGAGARNEPGRFERGDESCLEPDGPFAALVVESSFTSLPDVAAAANPLAGLLATIAGFEFDSRSRIGDVRAPVLILHGTRDKTVPFELGSQLFEAVAAPKRFERFEGGSHSQLHVDDAARYRAVFAELAARLRRAAAQRQFRSDPAGKSVVAPD